MRRSLVLLTALLLFGVGVTVTGSTAATDAPGCEGLSAYRVAMFRLWTTDDGTPVPSAGLKDRDPRTLSSDEWLEIADAALTYQRALRAITPPSFAAAWHQALIESAGLVESMSRSIAKDGIMAAYVYASPIDASNQEIADATTQGSATCADFGAFVRAYDALGDTTNATPAATPS